MNTRGRRTSYRNRGHTSSVCSRDNHRSSGPERLIVGPEHRAVQVPHTHEMDRWNWQRHGRSLPSRFVQSVSGAHTTLHFWGDARS